MGTCCTKESSSLGNDNKESEQNRNIDKQIKTDEKRMKTEVKLLLLGIKLYFLFLLYIMILFSFPFFIVYKIIKLGLKRAFLYTYKII